MVAAVQCGADAVYLGASDFNARKNAENFGGELDAVVLYCHARDVKVYVTLNTMVRNDELKRLENTIFEIAASGADGVIIQDFGVARAIHQMVPEIALHASTQMAVHNPQGVEFLVKQGFSRVVLAREMSFAEIARCRDLGAELEVFIHGALCVACSGQCLMSSVIGGRSGNRGMCAQPCRMQYRMDGRSGYLLSTKDLSTLESIQALCDAGANSLKIEGRLKRPEYVAVTTTAYREALNAVETGAKIDLPTRVQELRQMFNRGGFTRGYGFGVEDTELMFSKQPNHQGVEIGSCLRNGVISLSALINAQDTLVLRRAGSEDLPVRTDSAPVGSINLHDARKGDRLVRLVSQEQMNAAHDSFCGEKKKFPVDASIILKTGEPAVLTLSDGIYTARAACETVQTAQSRPIDPQRVRAQIEKFGDTPFVLRGYEAEIRENAFIPVSALNALRRTAYEKLLQQRGGKPHMASPLTIPSLEKQLDVRPELIVQSGAPNVLGRAKTAGCDRVAYAPEDLRLSALNAALAVLPETFSLVLPPVMTESTLNDLHSWAVQNESRIDRTYISNVGQFDLHWPGEIIADAQLNAANDLTVQQLLDWSVDAVTPSVELNCAQIRALHGKRQLIVYGRIPLMQLRHCPLRATQGIPGKHADCRRCDACAPSERIGAKTLIDRTGAEFPLRRIASEDGCVIQLLNSAILMPLRKMRQLPSCEAWRLLIDAGDPVEEIVHLYDISRQGGDPRNDAAWKILENMKTTTGHYFRGAE